MQVPEGWKVKKLEELCSKDAPITYGVLKPGEYFFKGIPLLQIKDLQEGVVLANDLHLISPKLDEEYKRSRISKNDILISLVGTIGRVAKYNRATPANIHRNIGRIRTDSHDYIYYFLTSNLAQNKIKGVSSGSSQSALNLSTLRSLDVPLPPLHEQQKIAQTLSTWDKAITATEQLLTNSQQQKKALMQQLLTGKKRLLDENGKRFSGEWQQVALKKIAKIAKGRALSSRNVVEGNYPVIAGGKTSPYSHNAFTHENIITVSASGAYAGYVSYHPCKIWASDCSVVEAKEQNILLFIFYLLEYKQQRIYSLQSGGAQPHVYPKDLDSLKISVPPTVEEQQKIATVLTAADNEITQLQQKLDQLKQEKKALIQQLLTGKRRVALS